MEDFPEILSLKAVLLTALEKVDAMEKRMLKKPSKRVQDRQQRVDALIIKKRAMIERNYRKKQMESNG